MRIKTDKPPLGFNDIGTRSIEIDMPSNCKTSLDRFTYVSEVIRVHEKLGFIDIVSITGFRSKGLVKGGKYNGIEKISVGDNISSKEILTTTKLTLYLEYKYNT